VKPKHPCRRFSAVSCCGAVSPRAASFAHLLAVFGRRLDVSDEPGKRGRSHPTCRQGSSANTQTRADGSGSPRPPSLGVRNGRRHCCCDLAVLLDPRAGRRTGSGLCLRLGADELRAIQEHRGKSRRRISSVRSLVLQEVGNSAEEYALSVRRQRAARECRHAASAWSFLRSVALVEGTGDLCWPGDPGQRSARPGQATPGAGPHETPRGRICGTVYMA
jgi:hypothetical protein